MVLQDVSLLGPEVLFLLLVYVVLHLFHLLLFVKYHHRPCLHLGPYLRYCWKVHWVWFLLFVRSHLFRFHHLAEFFYLVFLQFLFYSLQVVSFVIEFVLEFLFLVIFLDFLSLYLLLQVYVPFHIHIHTISSRVFQFVLLFKVRLCRMLVYYLGSLT